MAYRLLVGAFERASAAKLLPPLWRLADIHNGVRRYRWRTVLSAQRPSEVRGSAQRLQTKYIETEFQAEGKHNKLHRRGQKYTIKKTNCNHNKRIFCQPSNLILATQFASPIRRVCSGARPLFSSALRYPANGKKSPKGRPTHQLFVRAARVAPSPPGVRGQEEPAGPRRPI